MYVCVRMCVCGCGCVDALVSMHTHAALHNGGRLASSGSLVSQAAEDTCQQHCQAHDQ